jgi:hypothetical protein
MTTDLQPSVLVTAKPRRQARARRASGVTAPLSASVDAALACLRNLSPVDSDIEFGDVENQLRAALDATHSNPRGRAPARVACAHLAAGDHTEAYFALLVARDHLLEITR